MLLNFFITIHGGLSFDHRTRSQEWRVKEEVIPMCVDSALFITYNIKEILQ